MKQYLIFFGVCAITLSSSAQFTLVKKFNKPINFIEASSQGIAVAIDSAYFIQQDANFLTWAKFSVPDQIIDMDSKGNYVYVAASKRIYEHLTTPVKIHELTDPHSFESVTIYKGKKMVALTGNTNGYEMFCTFSVPFGPFDTLDYSSIRYKYPWETISADDSVAFIGYSNYYGGLVYNEPTKKWGGISPLEQEVIYDSYVNNHTIMARYAKAGTDFYISHDYGKTYTTKNGAFPSNSVTGSVMEYSNGNAFIGFGNHYVQGVFQSSDDGQTWKNILSDSVITGIAISGNEVFVTTNKGSLLKTAIKSIVTLIDETGGDKSAKIYYSNRNFYNQTSNPVEWVVYGVTGERIAKGLLPASGQISTELSEGVYLVEYKTTVLTYREKICVW
jgi:hypothetical protein